MDDGLQFANEDRSNYPAGPDTTKVIYKVGYHTSSGKSWKYIGNDQAQYQAELDKMEAENARTAAFKGWKPKPIEIINEIIDPEQSVAQEPVEEVVEQPVVQEKIEVRDASTGLTFEEMAAKGRELLKNQPIRDAFDTQVRELSKLAELLPRGYAFRLHQDHVPLSGVVIRWDAPDGKRCETTIESRYALVEAREFISRKVREYAGATR